jgi:hypothetical protein
MGKCQSAAHVVGAAEMRRVKAVASAMEMTPTVATAAMTATVTTAAVTTAAVATTATVVLRLAGTGRHEDKRPGKEQQATEP